MLHASWQEIRLTVFKSGLERGLHGSIPWSRALCAAIAGHRVKLSRVLHHRSRGIDPTR